MIEEEMDETERIVQNGYLYEKLLKSTYYNDQGNKVIVQGNDFRASLITRFSIIISHLDDKTNVLSGILG